MRFLKVSYLLLLSIVFIFCSQHSHAMSGRQHSHVWNELFGIADNSLERIQPLWDKAQDIIDKHNYDNAYRRLKDEFKWFNWGAYGHRLMFHWGFNTYPGNHEPLARQVRICLREYVADGKIDASEVEQESKRFFDFIAEELQGPRNSELNNAVTKYMGISGRQYDRAIATIIYDIHLISDFVTVNTSALPNLKLIENDLSQLGFGRLTNDGGYLTGIKHDFDKAIKIGRGRTNKARAELLLEAIKRALPEVLNKGSFKSMLQRKGIETTCNEDSK